MNVAGMPWFTKLPHRALISVQGEDRHAFLQGLVSNDMAKVENGAAIWAAFLTPQGKFLHEFFIVPQPDAVLLECEAARRDDLLTRLSRFKLRAKVALSPDPRTVGVAWGDGATAALETTEHPGAVKPLGGGVLYTDPRLTGAGVRWALLPEQIEGWLTRVGLTPSAPEAYDLHRIPLGLPDGSRDMEVEKALLLENGFAELHGVDFEKGCYVGQELTARTHYRALIKKRLMPVRIEGAAPTPGTPMTVGADEAGEIKSVRDKYGLALVRLDAWRKGVPIHAGDAHIIPYAPPWMTLPE